MVSQFGIAKLVNITPISLGFMVDIPNNLMGVINQQTSLGGHHLECVAVVIPTCNLIYNGNTNRKGYFMGIETVLLWTLDRLILMWVEKQ